MKNTNGKSKKKVLIIDDSAVMRQLLTKIFEQSLDLLVVGAAPDPYIAWEKIHQLDPDVITLDVEMPRMDGLTFLQKLMLARPKPVVMISSLTEKGCETTLRALELGAIDYVAKPKLDVSSGAMQMAEEIITKVIAAANAHVRVRSKPIPLAENKTISNVTSEAKYFRMTHKVIAIGASTGGTEALAEVLSAFPHDAPGTVMVLHMPEHFTKSYAKRLDGMCRVRVHEARDGDRVIPGHVLLAPGNFHMELRRDGAAMSVRLTQSEHVNRHRPSVDVLFNSCATAAGRNCVAAILTGMGNDGAKGLLALQQAEAFTIAQDEATCVVYGMPKEAVNLGAAKEVLPLDRIAPRLISLAGQVAK